MPNTYVLVIYETNIHEHLLTFNSLVKGMSSFVVKFYGSAMESLSLSAA